MAGLELKENQEGISLSEAVQLGAIDSGFYGQFFFPKTCRQEAPAFHRDMDEALDGGDRYVAFEIFRGGAKTTKVRLYLSKKIAYALARTILVVGKSEKPAKRTIEWIMTQVEHNTLWAQTFQLKKGSPWSGEEIEILHGVENISIRIIALGITGSTRGVNVDDYRPDLIVVDDPCDEENTATPEQREKTDDFINGSLRNSLAPTSEAPHAKMVFLQTLLNAEDSIARCEKDPIWRFLRFSIFTSEGESAWPGRWTTAELLLEKASFTARGKLHLWMREMECRIISNELCSFKVENLKYYDILPEEDEITYVLAIDPVPPPSEREIARGLKGKDSEVLAVIGRRKRKYFLAEYIAHKGHDPDWTIAQFFRLKKAYNPRKCVVESVNYQRTLKWLLEKAMAQRGEWLQMDDGTNQGTKKQDRRKKSYRIIDVMGSVTAERHFYVKPEHQAFIDQYTAYPNVNHDDVIEAVSMGIKGCMEIGGVYEGSFERIIEDEEHYETLEQGGCP